jgi:NTE family protein
MRFSRSALAALLLVAFACAGTPPPRTADPVATRLVPPRVGLALGGGGARGFAHLGVLRVLEQEKIAVDLVVGTSVGSLIGAFYADSGRVLDAELLALAVTREDLFDYGPLAFLSGGLAKGEGIETFLRKHLRHQAIEEFAVPFGAVATELRTGRTVVFDRGAVAPAVRASSAIPGVFAPVEIGGVTYVDGGVTDPVPAHVARSRGAELVIAVAIPPAVPPEPPRNPVAVAYHAVALMAAEIGRLRAAEADVVIEPAVGDVAYDDFTRRKQLIEAGEAAAREALPAIRAALAARSRPVTAQPASP